MNALGFELLARDGLERELRFSENAGGVFAYKGVSKGDFVTDIA